MSRQLTWNVCGKGRAGSANPQWIRTGLRARSLMVVISSVVHFSGRLFPIKSRRGDIAWRGGRTAAVRTIVWCNLTE
jgi:hypothetical protein